MHRRTEYYEAVGSYSTLEQNPATVTGERVTIGLAFQFPLLHKYFFVGGNFKTTLTSRMTEFDWKNEILIWTDKKNRLKPFQADLIELFQMAFKNTSQPEKAMFGSTSTSISVVVGGIYLIAIHSTDNVSLLLDREIANVENTKIAIAKSSKKFEKPLFWFDTKDLTQLKQIIKSKEIWESYYKASYKIFESRIATAYRSHIAKNKISLSDFYNLDKQFNTTRTVLEVEKELQEKVKQARKLSKDERHKKLLNSNSKPTKSFVRHITFNRNQYVIAEVLERANGICERCKKAAPFLKDLDNSPYLEVHHKKPLAESGDDTVENAIGLCPNCHRQAHSGKKTY